MYLKALIYSLPIQLLLLVEIFYLEVSQIELVIRWLLTPGIFVIIFFTGNIHNYSDEALFITNAVFYYLLILLIMILIKRKKNAADKVTQ